MSALDPFDVQPHRIPLVIEHLEPVVHDARLNPLVLEPHRYQEADRDNPRKHSQVEPGKRLADLGHGVGVPGG